MQPIIILSTFFVITFVGALGVDSESEAVRAKGAEKRMDQERKKRIEERKQEKHAYHKEKESERQKIRDKYALNSSSAKSKRSPSPKAPDTEPTTENADKKNCVIS